MSLVLRKPSVGSHGDRQKLEISVILRAAALILLWLFIARVLYSNYLNVLIDVNGQHVVALRGSTVAAAVGVAEIPVGAGHLRDVEGNVIIENGGESPGFFIDNKLVPPSTRIDRPVSVRVEAGNDVIEQAAVEEELVAPPLRLVGRGPFIILRSPGISGVKEVFQGEKSGKVMRERLIREPQPKVFSRWAKMPEKAVSLTFDDGPSAFYTRQILDVLDEYEVPAAFFVLGAEAEKHPEILREIDARGHLIGNHSFSHRSLVNLDDKDLEAEFARTERIIESATDGRPWIFRPPFGSLDIDILNYAHGRGYTTVLWNVDSLDWREALAGGVPARVLSQVQPGSVILLHDGGGKQDMTVKALPEIISTLREQGYTFVTLEAMLEDSETPSANHQ